MYYVNTLKHELIGTNAYKLQASLKKKVVVDGHGGHAALKFGIIAKENHDRLPTLYCTNSIKTSIKLDLLPVLVLVKTTERSKVLTHCLTAVKNM